LRRQRHPVIESSRTRPARLHQVESPSAIAYAARSRPDKTGNETGKNIKEWTVAVLEKTETSTSTSSHQIVSHQSSVISHKSSVISHQSSVISHQSSVISHQSSVIKSSSLYGDINSCSVNRAWAVAATTRTIPATRPAGTSRSGPWPSWRRR
jgi:hypothetical protein